ncbi:tRNA (adenosine(37)-N6)-threonylcarbamoyltransferase complex ATPase subunit type 1 TsaE [Patescibacteria group bacterium]|nr:tRNA (adenosine(37)-N6)-threonylcarbamoyltransferase complex ATPase subunit type 1 TsaE [Patescibacteria group bacterium]
MQTFITTSGKDTQRLGKKLSKQVKPGMVVALISDLGGGKTTLTQGIAKGLKIKSKVVSPTFVLERIYPVPKKDWSLYHYDLYRIAPDDMLVDEILSNAEENVVLIEWAEKIEEQLPKSTVKIKISILDENKRKITITNLK